MKVKKIIVIMVIWIILLCTNIRIVKASIQSNPNTHKTKNDYITNWIRKFREMETEGETMGLSETLNGDLTSSSESNNIDVHMIKSTEYGATAILSASAYGNPSNEQSVMTTTGNDTGVVIEVLGNWEMVAGGINNNTFRAFNERYFDTYLVNETTARVGDALGSATTSNPGCKNWHIKDGTNSKWVSPIDLVFIRGNAGMFVFYGTSINNATCSRGVVVCGTGM